jgi:hypothetical protein
MNDKFSALILEYILDTDSGAPPQLRCTCGSPAYQPEGSGPASLTAASGDIIDIMTRSDKSSIALRNFLLDWRFIVTPLKYAFDSVDSVHFVVLIRSGRRLSNVDTKTSAI